MSDTTPSGYAAAYRVLSVRMSDDTRAQLEVLAQLNERTVTEETRLALEQWVEQSKSDPKIKQRADAVRADIEREADVKRNAIAAIFDGTAAPIPYASKGGQRKTDQAGA